MPANHDAIRILALGADSVLKYRPIGGLAGIDYHQALSVCHWLDITPGPQLLRQLSTISAEIIRLSDESPNA